MNVINIDGWININPFQMFLCLSLFLTPPLARSTFSLTGFINFVLAAVSVSFFSYPFVSVVLFCIGQHGSETRTSLRRPAHQTKQNDTDRENDNGSSTMFQANYQYTPLKEYAAMKKDQPASDAAINGHCQSNWNASRVRFLKQDSRRDTRRTWVYLTVF